MSQLCPTNNHLQNCGRKDFVSALETEEFPPHNHHQCNTGYTIISHALFLTDPHTEHYLPEHHMGTNGTIPHSSATFPNTTVPLTTFLSTPASSTHISVGKKLSVSTVKINSCDSNYKTEWWSLCRSLDCTHFKRWKVLSQVPECYTQIQTHGNPTVSYTECTKSQYANIMTYRY